MELRLARHWWLLALRGLLTIIFGLVTILWPEWSLDILAMIFGAYMLVDGLFALGAMLTGRARGENWPAFLLEGLTGIIIGVLALLHPVVLVVALVYLVAAWAVLTGVLQIVEAVRLRRYIEGEFWLIFSALVSIVLGVLLAIMPGAGVLALGWILGIYALVAGILMVGLGFQLRTWHRRASGPAAPPV
jgi:uncharacterized membrane protein HdeD (DUF308 family)